MKIERNLVKIITQLFDTCSELLFKVQSIEDKSIVEDLNNILSAVKDMNNFFKRITFKDPELEKTDLRTIRHDLYTYLNHILGYSEMLIEDLNDEHDKEILECLERVYGFGSQLQDLIQSLTDTSQLIDINLNHLIIDKIDSQAKIKKDTSSVPKAEDKQEHLVLVVDDVKMNRNLLKRRLNKLNCQVKEAKGGYEALELLQKNSFDLILLDIMMPGLDGYQVLSKIKKDKELKHLPVIMISAVDEMDSVVRCIEDGAEDYLAKPFNPILLKARVNACLTKKRFHDQQEAYQQRIEEYNLLLEQRVRKQVKKITKAQMETIFALSKLTESRDQETGFHLERIREYAKLLALELRKTEFYEEIIDDEFIDIIYAASPLHDIGKVGVPDRILQKPGQLSDDEFELMKTHTTLGAETLRAVDKESADNKFVKMGIEIAESHHEKWNGQGYPQAKRGKEIPLPARIVALADVYDALRAKRHYKEPFSHKKSKKIILESRGSHFEPAIVDSFIALEAKFEEIRAALNEGS
ncbi:response regulator [Fuchsiella alkaliacetigena]|uniref:response regulator n=1 Tax=Fuchsiella alkaliacetigena TaxID=957042 RepID=UPI002009ED33|nr:response regulator [Fuchsiella alkaliacetigena]MCK8824028.1 response regulator [Fuchsiella alkaliacetigena]